MKKFIKALACAITVSFAFLACSDSSTYVNSNIGKHNLCKIKALSKTCNEERCWYDESDSAYFRPYDHNWVNVEGSVKEWMEEQFATESNDTKLFIIMDFFIHENYVSLLGISGQTEYEYYIDGVKVSYEEYMDSMNKMQEYERERAIRGKRDLPIPDPVFYETGYSWVGVPMTAKEIAELTENYKLIAVEFYREAVIDGALPLPPCY